MAPWPSPWPPGSPSPAAPRAPAGTYEIWLYQVDGAATAYRLAVDEA